MSYTHANLVHFTKHTARQSDGVFLNLDRPSSYHNKLDSWRDGRLRLYRDRYAVHGHSLAGCLRRHNAKDAVMPELLQAISFLCYAMFMIACGAVITVGLSIVAACFYLFLKVRGD